MGPKLNLEFLTPDECEKIIEVIQKDLVLQHVEQQRIWKINEEVKDINEFCKILGKQNSFNDNYCLYCFVRFRLFFQRKFVCKLCEFNFCSNCVVFDDRHGGNVCSFCSVKWQCQRQSLEWFYLRARSKFKRSGSSKVIRCLSSRNSLTAASKSQSLYVNSNIPSISDLDVEDNHERDNCFHADLEEDVHSEEVSSKEGDLDELTEKLMDVQSSCLKENTKMKADVAELISMERSLSEMDDVLQSLDNSLLEDHHHHQWNETYPHHYHQHSPNAEDCCVCHSTNETMLNLAANQISDITTAAIGVLEKTLNKASEIVKQEEEDDDYRHVVDDDDDDDDHADEELDPDDDDAFDVDSIELNDPKDSDDSTEKVDQSEESSCSEEFESSQSTVWMRRDKSEELKLAEEEVYKATSKTYVLGERLTDLKEEIATNNEEIFEKNVNFYEEEVAVLAVEINTNQRQVESLQKKVAAI